MNDETRFAELHSAVDAVRRQTPDTVRMQMAAARVRQALAGPDAAGEPAARLEDEAAYIALIPDYLADRLSESRRLLFEEESRRSLALRRALLAAKSKPVVEPGPAGLETPRWGRWLGGAAAAITLAFGYLLVPEMPAFDQQGVATVASLEGRLFEVTRQGLQPVAPGFGVDGRTRLRTAKGANATLRLDDGSLVEVNERAELSVLRRFGGNRIDVARGDIIVVASEQGSGTLDVITDELVVSVTGTIFAVGHGALGSLVSVIEGEVAVSHAGDVASLTPGQQLGSRDGFDRADFESRFAWSENADAYVAMLSEVSALQRDLIDVMDSEPRHSTRLLELAPRDTVVFVALPNAPEKLSGLWETVQARLAESPQLREWIRGFDEEGDVSSDELETAVDWLRDVGAVLGDETVVAVVAGRIGGEADQPVPLVMSEVDAAGFLAAFSSADGLPEHDNYEVVIVSDPAEAVEGQMSIWLTGDLLFASTSPLVLAEQAAIVAGTGHVLEGSFVAALNDAYGRGAEFLGAADLSAIPRRVEAAGHAEMIGFANAAHVIVERRQDGPRTTMVGQLYFNGGRRGMAGWLAEPAAMAALDFFSVESTLVSAVVVKEPAQLLDELLGMMRERGVAWTTGAHGIDLRSDLVGPLGGEFAVGLDGPTLPVPAWKGVIEVYDAPRLQYAIERLVEAVNNHAAGDAPERELVLASADVDGYEGYALTALRDGAALPTSAHYVYVDGFLVVAPNAGLLRRAIDTWQAGTSLQSSAEFRALLPAEGHLGFSGIAFNRVGDLMAQLVEAVPDELTIAQRQAIARIAGASGTSLSVMYGEPESIRFVMNGASDTPFSLAQVLSLPAAMQELQAVLPEGVRESVGSGTH